ncbi:MAG: permease [Geobacter sp.]|nr:MAG: permease [Geobacter sp.]
MLKQAADYLTFDLLGLIPGSRGGEALNFFLYDTVKIFFLLTSIIFVVAVIRSSFPPEKTKRMLAHKREYVGNVLAALLGIVTPFCSCSAVPLFIGFVESGVPLGVTFSFLVSSPMVNEVALIMLWGLFGWKIAAIYIGTGLVVAIVAGIAIGKLKMERYVQDYVWQMKVGQADLVIPDFRGKLDYAREYTIGLLKKIWPYVIVGIGLGAFIHGYVPADFLARWAGRDNPFAVPVAVALGVPLYSNVLKRPLLATFFGIVAVAITIVGYLFNAIL